MDTMEKMLANCGCEQYSTVFEKNGYDSAVQLLMMTSADFALLARTTDMLPGHVHLLQMYICRLKARSHVPEVTPTEEFVPSKEGTFGEETVAATSASFDSGPSTEGPNKKKEISCNMVGLEEEYDTWKQAKVASLRYNMAAGSHRGFPEFGGHIWRHWEGAPNKLRCVVCVPFSGSALACFARP